MSVFLHPRHKQVANARFAISTAVTDVLKSDPSITYAELISILADELRTWSGYAIRDERADPDEQVSPDGETPQAEPDTLTDAR